MCVVETASGCWGYLCDECQEDYSARNERLRRAERVGRGVRAAAERYRVVRDNPHGGGVAHLRATRVQAVIVADALLAALRRTLEHIGTGAGLDARAK